MANDAPLLQVENLTKRIGERIILNNVNFSIAPGNKIGVVGTNGIGKSTLIKTIADIESYDSGTIIRRRDLRIAYVGQSPQFDLDKSILQSVNAPAWMPGHIQQGYVDRVIQMLTSLKVISSNKSSLSQPVGRLSGGQRRRLAIACALASEADLLILDEPTNHLDIEAIEWIEQSLTRNRTTMIMVTHDRYFLQRVCNNIMEIDRGQVYIYEGNYDNFLRRRRERLQAENNEQQRIANTLRREKQWIDRQPQARGGKAKYRIDRYTQLIDSIKRPAKSNNLNLTGTDGTYIGSKIFEAVNVSKAFGDNVLLSNFNYIFARGEKLGIVGPNGAGKSTFIKLLLGAITPDEGHFDIGTTVRFGYYSQDGIDFDRNKKVIDAVSGIAEHVTFGDGSTLSAQQLLQRFGFTPADQLKYIYKLSGGERCRLQLATVLMSRPNFLVLDEPTNDLDLATLCVLEDYLENFDGCAIIISHDRYFLDNIVDHILIMSGNGSVKDFPGTYSEYRQLKTAQQTKETESKPNIDNPRQTKQRPVKLTYKERLEFDRLSAEIDELNAEKKRLEELFNNPQANEDISIASDRYKELTGIIDEKEFRWLELSEKA